MHDRGVLLSHYPEDNRGSRVLWILVGCLLIWRIHRTGSYLACAISGVAFFGAVLYSTGTTTGWWQAAMCALYQGYGLPLLTRTVRNHVS
jgi:hypothetical protein